MKSKTLKKTISIICLSFVFVFYAVDELYSQTAGAVAGTIDYQISGGGIGSSSGSVLRVGGSKLSYWGGSINLTSGSGQGYSGDINMTIGSAGSTAGSINLYGNIKIGTNSSTIPLTISNTGDIRTSGKVQGSAFYDNDQGNYYLDPANTTLSLKTAGPVQVSKLVDFNSTEYYLDPSSTTTSLLVAGSVGIGRTSVPSGYKLAVAGNIIAEKVVVKLQSAGWPDYVFNNDYKVKSLAEIESFIKANNHLEGVPSAAQVSSNGIDVAEMNAILLKKVEEMTLLMIEQDKAIKSLQVKLGSIQE